MALSWRAFLAFCYQKIQIIVRAKLNRPQRSNESNQSMRLDKVPGPNGLTVEFYTCFWDVLGPKLVEVANTCFEEEELTDSMKSSVTRVLFKKGDRKDLKNWRPILPPI